MDNVTLENFLTEDAVIEMFGLSNRSQLNTLRQKECLPFVAVSKSLRMYVESDLVDWLLNRRKILNQHGGVSDQK